MLSAVDLQNPTKGDKVLDLHELLLYYYLGSLLSTDILAFLPFEHLNDKKESPTSKWCPI